VALKTRRKIQLVGFTGGLPLWKEWGSAWRTAGAERGRLEKPRQLVWISLSSSLARGRVLAGPCPALPPPACSDGARGCAGPQTPASRPSRLRAGVPRCVSSRPMDAVRCWCCAFPNEPCEGLARSPFAGASPVPLPTSRGHETGRWSWVTGSSGVWHSAAGTAFVLTARLLQESGTVVLIQRGDLVEA